MKKILFFTCLVFHAMVQYADVVCTDADFNGQFRQDQYVFEHYFRHKKTPGVFMDIGAHDGITGNNSYFFEKRAGWSGVCIEARPELCQIMNLIRSCIVINTCVCLQEGGTVPFMAVEGCDEMLSGMCSTYDKRQLANVLADVAYFGGSCNVLQFPATRLQTILDTYAIKHIDYFSLDTEGSELEILQSFDFDTVVIDVMTIENNHNEPELRDFLSYRGFDFVHRLGVDDVYVRHGFVPEE